MQVQPTAPLRTDHTWYGALSSVIDVGIGCLAVAPDSADLFTQSGGGPTAVPLLGAIEHAAYGLWAAHGVKESRDMGEGGFASSARAISIGEFCKVGGYAAIMAHAPGLGLGLMLLGSACTVGGGIKADDCGRVKPPKADVPRMMLPRINNLDLR